MAAKFELDEGVFRTFLAEVVLRKNYGFKVIDVFEEEEDCPICSDTLKDETIMMPPCGDKFHHTCLMECIVEYSMKSCPSCSAEGEYDEYKFQQETEFTYPVPDAKETTSDKQKPILDNIDWGPYDNKHKPSAPKLDVHENYVDNSMALIPYAGSDNDDDGWDDVDLEVENPDNDGYDVYEQNGSDVDDSEVDEDVVRYMKGEIFDEQEDIYQRYADQYESMFM